MAHTPESALAHYKLIDKRRILWGVVLYGAAGISLAGVIFAICNRHIWHLNVPLWASGAVFILCSALALRSLDRIKDIQSAMQSLNDRYDLRQDDHL